MKKDMEILEKYSLAEDFWLQKLETVTNTPIFGDKITPEQTTHAAGKTQNQLELPFPPGLAGKVNDAAGSAPAKTFLIFLTALNIMVYKYTSLRDILVTTTSFQAEEDEQGDSDDVLLFFRTELDNESIPRDLLNAALQELNKADKHRQFQYESYSCRFVKI